MSDEVDDCHAGRNRCACQQVVKAEQVDQQDHQGEADQGARQGDAHITRVFRPAVKVLARECPLSVEYPAKRIGDQDG